MANQVVEQHQFQSEDETVTVEIEEDADGTWLSKNLVFLGYDLERDQAMLELGYPPTKALLLATLWDDPHYATRFSVCYSNDDFYIFDQWCMLGNPEARLILSYNLDSAERGSVAAGGAGFSLEQRLRMATHGDDPTSISIFLAYYMGTDLLREEKDRLQAQLPPADKSWLFRNSRTHEEKERFELLLETDDNCKLDVLRSRGRSSVTIKKKRELALLNSITNDETLARALCMVRFTRNYDYINQVKRIKDRQWVDYVLQKAPVEEAQMLRLMGF